MASTFTIKQEGYDDPYTYRLGMVGNGVRLCIAAKKEGGSQLFRKEDENIWQVEIDAEVEAASELQVVYE